MAKKKMRAESFGTLDEFRSAVNAIAKKIIDLRKEELERDSALQTILDLWNPSIETLRKEISGLLAQCDAYAKAHRDEVFPKGAKTSETELCTYFLRMGTPALKALNGKWTEADQVAACKSDPAWMAYVRTKESLDKDAIKAGGFSDDQLALKGLRIEQAERLTVEPKVGAL